MVPLLLEQLSFPWLWIPLTIWAAFAQTLRNAAQRHLVPSLGTIGATLVRFLYGLPFAAAYVLILLLITHEPIPTADIRFFRWVVMAGGAQIAATALLLRVMEERNFTLGVAYSKSEVIQAALFGAVLVGDPLSPLTAAAIIVSTLGVILLSVPTADRPVGDLIGGWASRTAMLGVLSGTGFALSAVGYRGAALTLPSSGVALAAAYTLLWAQFVQTVALCGWLLARRPHIVIKVLQAWRTSLLAGFMGAAASVGWFTAMALEPVAHVRTLGLIELLFSYMVSRRLFKERLRRIEFIGIALLILGLVGITLIAGRL
jgi:drug/metabolite transporter (DMT)-like permease